MIQAKSKIVSYFKKKKNHYYFLPTAKTINHELPLKEQCDHLKLNIHKLAPSDLLKPISKTVPVHFTKAGFRKGKL
jgi:hypothetical protein